MKRNPSPSILYHYTNFEAFESIVSEGILHASSYRYLQRKDIIEYSLQNFGETIIVKTIDEAFDVSNEIAPEHLEVLTKDPISQLPKVKNAGSIFLGENSPEPLGDYMSGTNHVLPTSRNSKILFSFRSI